MKPRKPKFEIELSPEEYIIIIAKYSYGGMNFKKRYTVSINNIGEIEKIKQN